MDKTVIVNIPMTANIFKVKYSSRDESLKASDREVSFPVLSFLENDLKMNDRVKFLLLAKKSQYSRYFEFIEDFKMQSNQINEEIGAKLEYRVLDSEFSENRDVHEKLMETIVENIDVGEHIVADITYGSKDLPIVVFTALNFAQRHLECFIDNIIYGQGLFNDENKLVDTEICDLGPLYALSSLVNNIKCDDPDKAKQILKSVISM